MEFTPTTAMLQSARAVFLSMAHTQIIRPIVESYERAILAKHQFTIGHAFREEDRNKIILEPSEAYLLDDRDFAVYFQECCQERDRLGLKVSDPQFCPLLVAENLQIQAERALVESMEPITHINPDEALSGKDGLDNYKKLIELSLKLMAPFVGTAKDILQGLQCKGNTATT